MPRQARSAVVEVEALVEVDAPVAVRPDAVADLPALRDHAVDGLARVVDAADRQVGGAHAKRAIARVHRGLGAIAQRRGLRPRRRRRHERRAVALAVVAHGAAEQLVHRQLECLAFDVPERQIHRAHGVGLLTTRRIEPGDVHLLPDRFDLERILADERARALLERVLRSALANPGDPHVGLDRADHVALVEEGVEVRRRVDSDPRDLAAGELSVNGFGTPEQKSGRRSQGLEEGSSVHGREDTTVGSLQSTVVSRSRQSQSSVRVGSRVGSRAFASSFWSLPTSSTRTASPPARSGRTGRGSGTGRRRARRCGVCS